MRQENSRPSRHGGKIWLIETVLCSRLSLFCRHLGPLKATLRLEEVKTSVVAFLLFFATMSPHTITTAMK
jgi:hypothetical protein